MHLFKTVAEQEAGLRTALINRVIDLARRSHYPGFDDSNERLQEKFLAMGDETLMAFYELIVVNSHRAGIQ